MEPVTFGEQTSNEMAIAVLDVIATGSPAQLSADARAARLKLFTQRDAPIEMMRKAVKRALSPIALRDDEEMEGG